MRQAATEEESKEDEEVEVVEEVEAMVHTNLQDALRYIAREGEDEDSDSEESEEDEEEEVLAAALGPATSLTAALNEIRQRQQPYRPTGIMPPATTAVTAPLPPPPAALQPRYPAAAPGGAEADTDGGTGENESYHII